MNATLEITLKSGSVIKAAAYQGDKPSNWNPSGNHYQILVDYFITPGNKKAFRFDFWDSYHNQVNDIPCDLRSALASWAMDVSTSLSVSSVDDIADEFGYDKPSEALRVYKGVKKAEKQYNRIEMTDEDLQELAEY